MNVTITSVWKLYAVLAVVGAHFNIAKYLFTGEMNELLTALIFVMIFIVCLWAAERFQNNIR